MTPAALRKSLRLAVFLHLFVSFLCYNPTNSGAVTLTQSMIDHTLASNELVFINFYADWCKFSNMLQPIFDEAADKVKAAFPDAGRVVMGKVDCDKEVSIATRFHISKYPTLKVIRNGQPAKREYRGKRSAEAFLEFVQKQLEDPIKEFNDLQQLKSLDTKKRIIIGFFDKKECPEYNIFRRAASNLKDDCQFHVGFGDPVRTMHPPGEPIIVFRPDVALSNERDETFKGSLHNYDEVSVWMTERCLPLVREITFENAEQANRGGTARPTHAQLHEKQPQEQQFMQLRMRWSGGPTVVRLLEQTYCELTEEGLPFLILFHRPGKDDDTVKRYKDIANGELISEKQNINFLTADGDKFAHPLHHLGKSQSDLPLIAIDSFRHMYLFPDIKLMDQPGRLKQFVQDLYSGKLHREYHYGPDPNDVIQIAGQKDPHTTPPESTFKKLGPSPNRYTLLRDEL